MGGQRAVLCSAARCPSMIALPHEAVAPANELSALYRHLRRER
jgi:hypothetical protein